MANTDEIKAIEIVKYRVEYIGRDPKLVIDMVKGLDEHGKYVKFLKMSEVEEIAEHCAVTFRSKDAPKLLVG